MIYSLCITVCHTYKQPTLNVTNWEQALVVSDKLWLLKRFLRTDFCSGPNVSGQSCHSRALQTLLTPAYPLIHMHMPRVHSFIGMHLAFVKVQSATVVHGSEIAPPAARTF